MQQRVGQQPQQHGSSQQRGRASAAGATITSSQAASNKQRSPSPPKQEARAAQLADHAGEQRDARTRAETREARSGGGGGRGAHGAHGGLAERSGPARSGPAPSDVPRTTAEDVAAVPPPPGQMRYSDASQRVARSRWLNLLQEEPNGNTPPSVTDLLSASGSDLLLGRRRTFDHSTALERETELGLARADAHHEFEQTLTTGGHKSFLNRRKQPTVSPLDMQLSAALGAPRSASTLGDMEPRGAGGGNAAGRMGGSGGGAARSSAGTQDMWLRRLAAQALGETTTEGARMMAEMGRGRTQPAGHQHGGGMGASAHGMHGASVSRAMRVHAARGPQPVYQ